MLYIIALTQKFTIMLPTIIFFFCLFFTASFIIILINNWIDKDQHADKDLLIGIAACLYWSVLFYLMH